MSARTKNQVTKRIWLKECYHDGFIIPARACKNCSIWMDYHFTKKDCVLLGYIEILPEQEIYLDKIIWDLNTNSNSEWREQIHYTKRYEQKSLKEIYSRG